MNKTYLGDGLYASFDGFAVHVTTERDDGEHEIILELETMKALEEYWELVHRPASLASSTSAEEVLRQEQIKAGVRVTG